MRRQMEAAVLGWPSRLRSAARLSSGGGLVVDPHANGHHADVIGPHQTLTRE